MQIAVNAGEAQVFRIIRTAVLPRYDVLEVQAGQRRVLLTQRAILTPVSRALPHQFVKRSRHFAAISKACRRSTAANLLART